MTICENYLCFYLMNKSIRLTEDDVRVLEPLPALSFFRRDVRMSTPVFKTTFLSIRLKIHTY